MEKNSKKLSQKKWKEENRQIIEQLKKERRLPSREDVIKAMSPPARTEEESEEEPEK